MCSKRVVIHTYEKKSWGGGLMFGLFQTIRHGEGRMAVWWCPLSERALELLQKFSARPKADQHDVHQPPFSIETTEVWANQALPPLPSFLWAPQ